MRNESTGADAAQLVSVVAENIRTLRTIRGLSLSELAQKAHIGKSTLSMLESGNANPSVETLWAIAAALDIPFSHLIEKRAPDVRLIRAGEGIRVASEDANHVSHLVATSPRRCTFDMYVVDSQPGTVRQAKPHTRGTVEHVFVIKGRMRLGPEESLVELGPGDAASFAGDTPHQYEALESHTRCIMIMAYE